MLTAVSSAASASYPENMSHGWWRKHLPKHNWGERNAHDKVVTGALKGLAVEWKRTHYTNGWGQWTAVQPHSLQTLMYHPAEAPPPRRTGVRQTFISAGREAANHGSERLSINTMTNEVGSLTNCFSPLLKSSFELYQTSPFGPSNVISAADFILTKVLGLFFEVEPQVWENSWVSSCIL